MRCLNTRDRGIINTEHYTTGTQKKETETDCDAEESHHSFDLCMYQEYVKTSGGSVAVLTLELYSGLINYYSQLSQWRISYVYLPACILASYIAYLVAMLKST